MNTENKQELDITPVDFNMANFNIKVDKKGKVTYSAKPAPKKSKAVNNSQKYPR